MLLYNSKTRKKEEFVPRHGKQVQMYVCGITPNNATHLGHAFTYVSFDVLVRYLQYKGYTVEYVQNATDVNDSDDVLKQAKETGKTWKEIAAYWIKSFHTQMDALNVLRPSKYILASSMIEKIIEINKVLEKKKFAYEKEGNLYFDISKFPKFGELSHYNEKQMLYLGRERGINPNDSNKRNPLDFVLWFASSETPQWISPWSKGRPGWHIECNAIINKYLGDQIDIHGGGRDLIFPHHESELAQNDSYTGKSPYVKYWMHTGTVLYEGEKMAKSLGNLVLVKDLLKVSNPNYIRWMLLSHYWRQPWEYCEEELTEAENQFKKVCNAMKYAEGKGDLSEVEKFMDNDMFTPRVLEYLVDLAEEIEENHNKSHAVIIKATLELLGFNV